MGKLSGIFVCSSIKPEAYYTEAIVLRKKDGSPDKTFLYAVIPDGRGNHIVEAIEGGIRRTLGAAQPLQSALENVQRQFALRMETLKTMAEHGYAALEIACQPPSHADYAWIPVRSERQR